MRLFPVAGDGWRFILPLLVVGIALVLSPNNILLGSGILCLGLAAFCLYFFRDFNRKTVTDDKAIYSPGDGKVLEVVPVSEGLNIRIFLSVMDGHVQRSPVEGKIQKIEYKKGKFLDARDPNAHLENEQNLVTIVSAKGTLVVNQIAGLIARRIVCWAKEGDALGQGQRYGLIRFGSQVDVIVPKGTEICVQPHQRVVGGETVIARWEN